jgi:hypothetical protein
MKRHSTVSLALLAFVIWPTWVMAQDVLPRPEEPFKGHMTRRRRIPPQTSRAKSRRPRARPTSWSS